MPGQVDDLAIPGGLTQVPEGERWHRLVRKPRSQAPIRLRVGGLHPKMVFARLVYHRVVPNVPEVRRLAIRRDVGDRTSCAG